LILLLNSPSHDVVHHTMLQKAVQKYSFFLNYQKVAL